MAVGDRGKHGVTARNAAGKRCERLEGRPAEVGSAGPVNRQIVDLLVAVLPGVRDRDVVSRAIEGEPPRVAQAIGPDLVAAGPAHEWVAHRDPVSRRGGVDAQDLPAEQIDVLWRAPWITGRAAISGGDVEVPVRPEGEQPPVVSRRRLADLKNRSPRVGIRDQGVGRASPVLGDDQGVTSAVGDVEEAGPLVVGWERDRGHSRFAADAIRIHAVPEVQEGPPQQAVVRDHPDGAARLHHEERRAGAGRLGQEDGVLHPGEPLDGDELRAQRPGCLAICDPDDAGADGDECSDDGFDPAAVELRHGLCGASRRLFSAPVDEPVDRPVERGGVEGAIRTLAEGAQVAHPDSGRLVAAGPRRIRNQ